MTDSIEHDIREAWDKVRDRFERVGPEQSSLTLAGAWSESVQKLRETFAVYVGPAVVDDRFQVPEDYAAFMRMLGGEWAYRRGWGRVFSAQDVARITEVNCNNWAQDRREDDGLWLDIGYWGSHHDYFICCDLAHPLFGVVVEGEDAHPWQCTFRAMWVLSPNFLGFLRDYLPGRTSTPSRLTCSSVPTWLEGRGQ